MKNTKELRKFLTGMMKDIKDDKVTPAAGRNIIGMANQIHISMQTELKKQKLDLEMGRKVTDFGKVEL